MWREGSPAEQSDGGYFLTTALMAPEDYAGPLGASKDVREVHQWRSVRQGTAFQQQRAQLPKGTLPVLALQQKRLSEPMLPKAAADLRSVAASAKHEGLIFRRWEA